MIKDKTVKVTVLFLIFFSFLFFTLNIKAETVNQSTGDWTRYQNTDTNNGVTQRPGPPDQDHAFLLWQNNMAEYSMAANPKTPPLIVGDSVYTASENKVFRLNKKTGEVLDVSANLKGEVHFGLHPMVYAKGKLYVMTNTVNDGSMIEALDAETLKVLWHSEAVLGEVYSPLYYKEIEGKGYLYTGVWEGIGGGGTYFCVPADEEASSIPVKILWKFHNDKKEKNYGFYWDGAYASDKFIAFASENSESNNSVKEGSAIYTLNPLTGKLIDKISNLKGNIRNTVVYDQGYLYVATAAGRLYRIKVTENGIMSKPNASGEPTDDFSYIDLGGPIRTTTILYKGRIYCGVGEKVKGDKTSHYAVVNGSGKLDDDCLIYTVPVDGEPTGTPLLSTAEESKTGNLYVYFTCNVIPGGIYYFTDSAGQDRSSGAKDLFRQTEDSELSQFSISSLALDNEGTLYYKNDSNYVMAITPRIISGISVDIPNGMDGSVSWQNHQVFNPCKTQYQLKVGGNTETVDFNISSLDGENESVTSEFIVNGKSQSDNNQVNLSKEGETKVEVKVTRKAIVVVYEFNIHKVTEDSTDLEFLCYGESPSGKNYIQESLALDREEYTVNFRNMYNPYKNKYLWIQSENPNASVEVYAIDNVTDDGNILKENQKLITFTPQDDGAFCYEFSPTNEEEDMVVKVTVSFGNKKKDYRITWLRKIPSEEPVPDEKPNSGDDKQENKKPSSGSNTIVPVKPVTPVKKPATVIKNKITPPKKVTGFKVKRKKNRVTLTWKKIKRASGYQIIIAKDKKFHKSKKVIKLSKGSVKSKKIRYSSKTKYVRIRAFVKKNGKTVYGSYSKTVKIK